mmetsp:Transcript_99401/g.186729  ORF Transcript_99401/g.186729 Transcript_99401/m.186729 type:complete len:1826 (+) Transcript_99401:93-5570(+)
MPRPKKRGQTYQPGPVDKELLARAMGVFPDKEPDVYEFLVKALEQDLPDPWTEHADKKGRIFYWNPASRQSSWSHPLASTHKSLVHAYRRIKSKAPGDERSQAVLAELDTFHKQGEEELEQWRMSHAPDGTPYYYKTGTQQTRWDNPRDELVSHQELRICMLSDLLADPAQSSTFTIQEAPPEAIEDGAAEADATADSSAAAARSRGDMEVTILPIADKPEPKAEAGTATDVLESLAEEAETNLIRGKADTNLSRGDRDIFDGDRSFGRGQLASQAQLEPKATWGSIGTAEIVPAKAVAVRPDPLETRIIASPGKHTLGTSLTPSHSRPISPIAPLLTPHNVRVKPPREDLMRQLEDRAVDVGWLQPDEIGLHLGMNFDETLDQNIFAIMRPIFTADVPLPWKGADFKHGRTDFLHPGTGELRQAHPLFSFFGELLAFLREQVLTDVPLTQPMSAAIFCEASPQCVRNRLGVWEGPIQDPTKTHINALYERILPGKDGACVVSDTRQDDPRAEAAANVIARLDAWHHLWNGFAPEEPFPLVQERIPALATQLSECVVIAPGNRADKEWVLHQWNWQLDIKAPADRMQVWTKEEIEKQSEVAQILGHVYGKSINAAAYIEAPVAKDKDIAFELLRVNYRVASTRIEEEEAAYDDVEDEFEDEVEEEEDYDEDEYSDDLADEPAEEETDDLSATEEDVDSLSASGSSTGRRRAKRKKGGSAGLDDIGEDDYDDEESEDLEEEAEEPASEAELKVETPERTPPPEVVDYLGLKGSDHTGWSEIMLRPLTPPESPREKPVPFSARSLPKDFVEREKKGFDPDIWGGNQFLKSSVIKPYLADLGWRCHLEIVHGMWTESEEAAQVSLEETASPLAAARAERTLRGGLIDSTPIEPPKRDTPAARLDKSAEPEAGAEPPASPASPLSPKSPGKKFRGIEMPPVALDQVRERNEAEMNTFREMLKSSNDYFDSCMSGRGHPSRPITPLANPSADAEVWKDRVSTRPALQRAYLPVREKLNNDEMNRLGVTVKGSVAPVPSPGNQARGPLPVPKYLLPLDSDVPSTSGPKPGYRPSSAEPKKETFVRGQVPIRSSSADARVRRLKGEPSLVRDKNVLADMLAEQVRTFLTRKCGRMEAVMTLFDTNKLGYLSREDWVQGLTKLEYEKIDKANEIFNALDKNKHHVLRLSDLQGRASSEAPLPDRDPIIEAGACLLQELVSDELQSIVHEAMFEVLGEALRKPATPLDAVELPDVKAWLVQRKLLEKEKAKEEKRKQKEKEKAERLAEKLRIAGEEGRELTEEDLEEEESEASETESEDEDPEAAMLRELRGEEPVSKQDKGDAKKKGKKGPSVRTTAALLARGAAARKRLRGQSAGTEESGRSSSPGSRHGSKVRPKKKQDTTRSQGMLAKILAKKQRDAEGTGDAGQRDPTGSPGGKRVSASPQRGSQSPGQGQPGKGPGKSNRAPGSNRPGGHTGGSGSPNARRGGTPESRRGGTPLGRRPGRPGGRGGSPNTRTGQGTRVSPPGSSSSSRLRPGGQGSPPRRQGDPRRANSLPQGKVKQRKGYGPTPVTQRDLDRRYGAALGVKRRQGGATDVPLGDSDGFGQDEFNAASGTAYGFDRAAAQAKIKAMEGALWQMPADDPDFAQERNSLMAKIEALKNPEKAASPSAWAMHAFGGSAGRQPRNHHWDEDEPLASFDVGFHQQGDVLRRPGIESWNPRRPEDVCKTYGHIFKLLNDPLISKKHMPKKKPLNVSLPRLPAAGQNIVAADAASAKDLDLASAKLGGKAARSAPDLAGLTGHSTTAGSSWRAGTAASMDTTASASYVTLPRLVK